jgi:hypothetical protein
MAGHRKLDRLRVDTRFSLFEYCSHSEPSLNCGSLRFGEVLDFSVSFCLRHPATCPAAFQIMFKNNAESSLLELLRDVFSKNFQGSMPIVWFLMFISFFTNAVLPAVSSFCYMACAVYKHFWRRSRTSFAGQVVWRDAETHTVEITGKTSHSLDIELKK